MITPLLWLGEPEEEGYEDEYQLEDVDIGPADYITPTSIGNWRYALLDMRTSLAACLCPAGPVSATYCPRACQQHRHKAHCRARLPRLHLVRHEQ